MRNQLNNRWEMPRESIFLIIGFIFTIFSASHVIAAEWVYGQTHTHTGYSTVYGYDSNPVTLDDNCAKENFNFLGYSVDELKEESLDQDQQWLAFSDHSYCLNSDEFDTVKQDCEDAQDGSFSCLWGEELTTIDTSAGSFEEGACTACLGIVSPICGFIPEIATKAAHVGAYGLDNLISQDPNVVWCPTSPAVQSGINNIKSLGGFAVANHPASGEWDFESVGDVSNLQGIEIWNGEWDNSLSATESNDAGARTDWINKLQDNEKVYAFAGTDTHSRIINPNSNFVRVDSLIHSDLQSALEAGTSTVSNNGFVILEAKKSTQSSWTQMGSTLTASQSEILNLRLQYSVDNSCTLKIYSSKIGSNLESVYTVGNIAGTTQVTVDYPLATTGDFYYRSECISSDGTKRVYTNPIWVNVGSGGSCTEWQGSTCNINTCESDEIYQTRTCNGNQQSRCVYSSSCPGAGVNQCTPSSCDAGYSSSTPTCSMVGSHYTCDRTCTIPASCGSYGSWQNIGSTSINWQGDFDRKVWKDGSNLVESSSLCYNYYGNTEFIVSNWGSADSYKLQSRVQRNENTQDILTSSSTNYCTTSSSSSVFTSTYARGRGSSGTIIDADGFADDYGASTCTGNPPLLDLEGSLTRRLYYQTATWNSADTYHNYCDVPDAYSVSLLGPIYGNVNAQCDVDVDTDISYPSQIDVKWYVNGNFVDSDNCYGSGGNQCDHTSGRHWYNIFQLDQSYYSAGDEVYCTSRGRGNQGGNGAYEQSNTRTVTNRVPTWSSVDLDKTSARQSNSITAIAGSENDLDDEPLSMYCCNGASCTPSTSNFDFCFASGDSSPYDLSCIGEGVSGDGIKTVRCALYDGSGYSTILSDTYTADNTGPVISSAKVNASSVDLGANIRTNCTLTDSGVGINSVWLTAAKPISSDQNYSMSLLSGNTYYRDLQLNEDGIWNLNCWANDTLGNANNKTIGSVEAIANDPPSTPTTLLCNSALCSLNGTFENTIAINCSGSVDLESDPINYAIEASFNSSNVSLDVWSDSNFSKRKNIILSEKSGSKLNNYSVYLNVTYDADMQPDFDDIRFVESNVERPYWIEKKENSNYASVWIKVSELNASTNKTISMYYGNSSTGSKSNINEAFLFADDFNDNSLNTSKWNVTTKGDWSVNEVGSTLLINGTPNGVEEIGSIYTKGKFSFNLSKGIELRFFFYSKTESNSSYKSAQVGFFNNTPEFNRDGWVSDNYPGAIKLWGIAWNGQMFGYTGSQRNTYVKSNLNASGCFNTYNSTNNVDWNLMGTICNNTINQPLGFGVQGFGMSYLAIENDASYSDGTENNQGQFDTVFVRNYVGSEPIAYFGDEGSPGGSSWFVIGNHSQSNLFDWDIRNITSRSNVDLRCRAIGVGSSIYSSYYEPHVNLTIVALNNTSKISFVNPTPTDSTNQNVSSFSSKLLSSAVGTHYAFVDLDRKLSLWIRGDDKNASGSFVDISGSNNTITTVGSPQNPTGAFGTALSFVNTNSAGLRVPNSNSINVTDAFTISFWMKGSDTRYGQFLAGKWDGVTVNTISWQVSLATGGICNGLDLYASQDGASVNRVYTRKCNQNYQDGQWHHVVGVFNPGQEISLYVDGVSSGATTVGNIATMSSVYSNSQSIYIGNRTSGVYNGSIDEVLLFKRALTQSEVNSLYNAQSNQYVNTFISLLAGAHTIKGFAVNSFGNLNNTETRTISITAPYSSLQFISPTPTFGSRVNASQFTANLSSSDSGTHYSTVDFDRDIVLWMPFDDVNVSGDPIDISTYSSHGSKQGNANQSASGNFGKSFTFDGVGDGINIPDQTSLDLNSSFSTSFWFKGNASTASQPFVGKWNGTSGQIAWFADLATGGVCDGIDFYVSEDGGSTDRVYVRECNKRYQDNQWHHFVGTFDASNSIKMYIDGTSVGSVQGTISTVNAVYTNNQSVQIGTGYTTAQYNGSIDDVLVFRRSLSQQEVSALYSSGSNQYSNSFSQVDDVTHAIRGYAMNSYGVRNSTELRTFKVLLPLDIYSLTYSTINNTKAISFWINNTLSVNITNIAWNVTTGLTAKYSNFSKNITLTGGEAALVIIAYNYTTPGTYPLTATAYNANYKDVEGVSVTI